MKEDVITQTPSQKVKQVDEACQFDSPPDKLLQDQLLRTQEENHHLCQKMIEVQQQLTDNQRDLLEKQSKLEELKEVLTTRDELIKRQDQTIKENHEQQMSIINQKEEEINKLNQQILDLNNEQLNQSFQSASATALALFRKRHRKGNNRSQ